MNRRQKIKQLKKQNKLMRDIIKKHPDMERLFILCMKGTMQVTKVPVETLKAYRLYPKDLFFGPDDHDWVKRAILRDFSQELGKYTKWTVRPSYDPNCIMVEGELKVARIKGEEDDG